MSNRCGACGQPRDAWKTIEKTVAVMAERAENPRRRPPTGALKFMQRLAVEGGRIVSTASLTPEQVIAARESQRLFVTGEGLGFVIFPDGVKATHAPRYFCNKCGAVPHIPRHQRPDGKDCNYLAAFVGAPPAGVAVVPKREAPPGKWKVDMPDGTYGRMPGDPPGPASVQAVIGGYVYDVEPQTGRLIACEPPTGYRLQKFNEEMQRRTCGVGEVPAPQTSALMEINYEPRGRCFWHSNCTAQRHAPPMRIAQQDKPGARSLLECTACGERGWYHFTWVGLARVPVEPKDGVDLPDGAQR